MKNSVRFFLLSLLASLTVSLCSAATTFTLNPLFTFGPNSDGSVNPGQSIGISPVTGLPVLVTAQNTPSAWNPGEAAFDIRPAGSTNGFNMRGIAFDPISGNFILCDTHSGSSGSGTNFPWSSVYVLDRDSGQIIGALNTNGIIGGSYAFVAAGVSSDGVVYACNQTTASQTLGFKLYRWPTANTNDQAFTNAPVVAFSNLLNALIGTSGTIGERIGQTMDVRGSGTNTQIILGTSSLNGTGTNIFLFTTADGTNFAAHRISFPGVITTASFNDGIAFGPTNTFWAKQAGKSLLYMSYNAVALAAGGNIPNGNSNQITGTVISSFAASSPNDPLLNICAIAYDPVNKLLAGLEEIGGIANGGRGKVWLFDIPDPTNRPPSVLASRIYNPNFTKAIAPMGYVCFGNGRLYANVSNNGLLASTVDSVPLSVPTFTTDLPLTTRAAETNTAHFEVFAVADVTNYQWYSNNVPISGANTYFYDLPNASTNMGSPVFKVVAFNAAGSSTSVNSTLTVVSAANFFSPKYLWNTAANAANDPTNYITSGTAQNERTIAYNSLSNQLLVVRGPTLASLTIFVVNAHTGGFLYTLNTNGITGSGALTMVGIGVADDGAVYAATVNAAPGGTDSSFKVYRWADTGSNTTPQVIFGTNSSAANGNPIADLVGAQYFRFGDTLAVRGSGNNTEIILDSQNSTKYVGILRPVPDGFMTNWTQTGYLLQNIQGSYGSEAYGTTIGRSLQFGNGNTFWQKRYNGAVGAPLAQMSYTPGGGGLCPLVVANVSASLYVNGSMAINSALNVGAGVNFGGLATSTSTTAQDKLEYYDLSDPAQAVVLSHNPLTSGASGGYHQATANAISQVIFGVNSSLTTNYIFVIVANNGITAYVLDGGVTPPPRILAQPRNLRVLEGTSGSLSVSLSQPAAIEWFKGTNSPVDTGVSGLVYNIANATTNAAGDYFLIATNVNGAITSQVAHVSVQLTNDNYTLSQVWAAGAGNGSFPYITSNGGANTPNERAFAYNALSNQLIVVRCPPASTLYSLWVVDATTGANLYTLNTTGVIHEGGSEVTGSNPIDMVGAAAADDGAIYICSESPNASGGSAGDTTKMFHVFRWANSGPSTAPTLVYEGDPSGQLPGVNLRWGDVMAARGSGTNTELIVNAQDQPYAAVLKPLDSTLNAFTNFWFGDIAGGGSIGRSIQFGTNNTVFEKRKGALLLYSAYNLTNQTAVALLSVDSSSTLGGVAVDTAHNLAAGVDFVGTITAPLKPDAVALYDITDISSPMFIKRYNFPSNQVANANVICETIIAGSRGWSLDANNGLMAFNIIAPVNSMILHITLNSPNVTLSWGNADAILQSTPSLSPQSWTDLAGPGLTNSVQPALTNQFYRLIQRF